MFNWVTCALAEETAAEAEAVAEAAPKASYFTDTLLKKLINADVSFWLMLLGLAALAAVFFAISKSSKSWNARSISFGATSIALSFVLSYIRIFRMPQGGSITPASMLPLMLFSASYGIGPGVAAGCIYGFLQYLQGGDFLNVWQVLFDYLIAFAALGLAGLYKHFNKRWQVDLTLLLSAVLLVLMLVAYPTIWWLYAVLLAGLVVLAFFVFKDPEKYRLMPAMAVAVLGRAISAVIAGLMWVAAYPVEGQAPIVYSVIYNGAYLVPELVICMILAGMIGNRLMKMIKNT